MKSTPGLSLHINNVSAGAMHSKVLSICKAVSEFAATATATARFPCHPALKFRTSLATPLATAVAVAKHYC